MAAPAVEALQQAPTFCLFSVQFAAARRSVSFPVHHLLARRRATAPLACSAFLNLARCYLCLRSWNLGAGLHCAALDSSAVPRHSKYLHTIAKLKYLSLVAVAHIRMPAIAHSRALHCQTLQAEARCGGSSRTSNALAFVVRASVIDHNTMDLLFMGPFRCR
jgi:hypothetical protein